MTSGASIGYDRHITIFSPEGRLYQIEYALKAVKNAGLTAVSLRYKDGVAMVVQKKVPDKLIDSSSIKRVFQVTAEIGVMVVGRYADSMYLVRRARYEAAEFKYKSGHEISAFYLAKRMANLAQLCTQHAYMRTMGTVMVFAGMSAECGPTIHRVDPTGIFDEYIACSAGTKEQEGTTTLEKKIKKYPNVNTKEEAIKIAVKALQKTIGSDLKSDEMEIAVVDEKGFCEFSEAQIETTISDIHEARE